MYVDTSHADQNDSPAANDRLAYVDAAVRVRRHRVAAARSIVAVLDDPDGWKSSGRRHALRYRLVQVLLELVVPEEEASSAQQRAEYHSSDRQPT